MDPGRLTGKRAVITGGDSGIGRAVAIAFAREGADVLIPCLHAEEEDARRQRADREGRAEGGLRCRRHPRRGRTARRIVDRAVAGRSAA